jgi:glycerate kinase
VRILVAPNSYKECASSSEAADLIAEHLARHGYSDVTSFPLSDGGDGFLEVCERHKMLNRKFLRIQNCFNAERKRVPVGIDKKSGRVFIEAADIIGLKDIPKRFRRPTELNSNNFGLLLHRLYHSRVRQARTLTIGIGGTGTNDLGLGLCRPFGLKLFDKWGKELSVFPKNYSSVATVLLPAITNLAIEVVLDVEAPMFGKLGPSKVFSRQKGASEKDVALLELGVRNIVRVLERDHGIVLKDKLYGAGGGLTLGLSLIAEVRVILAKQFLVERLRLVEQIKRCDVVITGEGKFDKQSFMSKATGVVLQETAKQKKQAIMIVGSCLVSDMSFRSTKPAVYEMSPLFFSERDSIRFFRKGIARTISAIAMNGVLNKHMTV